MSEMKKTAISAVAVLLALVGTTAWAYTGWGKCKTTEKVVEQKQTKLSELQGKIAAIPALRQEKSKLQEELTEYETILPNDRELDKIFDTLSDFTKDSKVVITEFKPERERQNTGKTNTSSYKQVSYDLKLEGGFFEVTKFINLLENYKRFVRVDSFEIGKRNLDEPLDEVKLKISTFVYDPKAKPTRRKPARSAAKRGNKAPAGPPEIPFNLEEERAKQYEVLASLGGLTRRDPFTNPLTRRHTEGPDKSLIARPKKLTPAEEQQLIEAVQKELSAVTTLVNAGQFDDATDGFTRIQDKLTHKFADPALASQVTMIRARAAEVEKLLSTGRGKKLFEIVTTQYEKMKQAFDVADYEGIAKIHLAVADSLKKCEGIDYEGLPELVTKVTQLAERAKVCAEFACLDIDVQGVLWTRSGRAAAIINKQSVIEGDKLKFGENGSKGGRPGQLGQGDIFVHEITRDKITFRYKGERIEKVLVE